VAADPRVDSYIEQAPAFAQQILQYLRDLIHTAVPGLDETIKWSRPQFMVAGKNLASLAAFKAHVAFTIHGDGRQGAGDGMGQFGRITTLADLPPPEEMVARLQAARDRIASPERPRRPRPAPRPELPVPADLVQALSENPVARATFTGFAPSHRREYIEWIIEAKQAATRARRIAQTVGWLAEGRTRNWQYERR
jgi:uncharacterized protein YdeI (YjbR/CyaY-like superfamily)